MITLMKIIGVIIQSIITVLLSRSSKPNSTPSPDKTPAPIPQPIPTEFIKELLKAHNEQRVKRGLSELTIDTRLCQAALKHADWMSKNKTMSHKGSNGSNHSDRIKTEGYIASYSGENIAYGYKTVASVMTGWMWSRGHRANILSARYMHVGFGLSDSYWCAVFATPNTFSMSDNYMTDQINESGPLLSE